MKLGSYAECKKDTTKEVKAKELLKEATLECGTKLASSNHLAIHPPLISDTHLKAKSQFGNSWIVFRCDTTETLWQTEVVGGWFSNNSHTLVKDKDDHVIATILTETGGHWYTSVWATTWICRNTPTFEGQQPLAAEELKGAGLSEDALLYRFGKIDTERQLSTAHAEYSVVGSETTCTPVYTADKLPAMDYMAVFCEASSKDDAGAQRVVAKASNQGMGGRPILEAASGVDLLALVCMGSALVNNDGTL